MAIEFPDGLMVSVSGFRGRVGDPLTPELVCALAAAYGDFLQREGDGSTVVVGRDSRTSGAMLREAVLAGLRSVGCDVVDLGVVPTPTLMLAVEESDAAGGLGITASHNPAEWNALKFAASDGVFLDADRMRRFQDLVRTEEPRRASWDALGQVRLDDGAVDRHLERVLGLDLLDIEGLRARGFVVALDCVNGAGGPMMIRLLEALGCSVHAIGVEPSGVFPRDPEPTAQNLGQLRDHVVRVGADIGLAVDPDADRLSLVDELGRALGEDFTLALAAAPVLDRAPGVLVTNLSTSQVVEDVARSRGGSVVRAPVGEINVARAMQRVGAVVGGEGNGGVILPRIHHTRDAPVGAALILQHMLDEARPVSAIAGAWPAYTIVKKKVTFPREALSGAYQALEEAFAGAEVDRADGLRLAWADRGAWLHVRPSGTEPVVRLIAEAREERSAQELIDEAEQRLFGTR